MSMAVKISIPGPYSEKAMRIKKIDKSDAAFSVKYHGCLYHVFYHRSILMEPSGFKRSTERWYYVVSDNSNFPMSPMVLGTSSLLTLRAEDSVVIKNANQKNGLSKIIRRMCAADYLPRSIHENLRL